MRGTFYDSLVNVLVLTGMRDKPAVCMRWLLDFLHHPVRLITRQLSLRLFVNNHLSFINDILLDRNLANVRTGRVGELWLSCLVFQL